MRWICCLLLGAALSSGARAQSVEAGFEAYEKGDYATALTNWQPLADAGDSAAQYNLGYLYEHGHGVAVDPAEAAKWYRKSAEQGDADAQRALGAAYAAGSGVDADRAAAILWYRKAADQGDGEALTALQTLYTPIEDPFNGQLQDPRPASAVLDKAALLNPADLAAIDGYAREVRRQTDGELMVVTLPTIGGSDPREYATQMFNTLKIGSANSDRGVLLLVAVADRKAELILGTGLDTPQGRVTAHQIMDQHVVPGMRAGTPSAALLAASHASAQQLLGASVTAATPAPGQPVATFSAPAREYSPDSPGDGLMELVADPTVQKFAGGGLGGFGLVAAMRAWLRRRPRACKQCNMKMERLSEGADDAHLSQAEKVEERIKSVDYDVWHCGRCATVVKLRYGAFLTSYKKCPGCKARTKSSTSITEIAATESSGGRARVNENCEHCGWHRTSTHSTPRISRSSSSSSSSSGGGRSSGGGASGSW